MTFSKESLDFLKCEVSKRLSYRRFLHTESVAKSAVRLAGYCLPGVETELVAAALLHDISKELPLDEQLKILAEANVTLDEEDIMSEGILHSYSAPEIIKRDFSQFATERVLSAVLKHTIGSPDMSVFDEIIFLSDFIEDTRTYDSCVKLRNFVWDNMSGSDFNLNLHVLHAACIEAIDSTVINLINNKRYINSKNILTRNALLSKI